MAEVPGPSEPVMPVKPAVSGVWLLSGMTDGVEKVFVKEKVLAKDGVGCVKGLEGLSLRRATRSLEKRKDGRWESRVVKTPDQAQSPTCKDRGNWRKGVAGQASRCCSVSGQSV